MVSLGSDCQSSETCFRCLLVNMDGELEKSTTFYYAIGEDNLLRLGGVGADMATFQVPVRDYDQPSGPL